MKAWIPSLAILAVAGWQGSESEKPVEPLKRSPIEYFNDHCAHCHGKNGINFESGFADEDTDKALSDEIKEMADGPGQAPMEKEDLPVQVALHRAFSADAPFFVWTKRKDLELRGEVGPDVDLIARVGDKEIPITVKEDHWTLTLKSGDDLAQLQIEGRKGNKAAILDFKKLPFSQPKKPKG